MRGAPGRGHRAGAARALTPPARRAVTVAEAARSLHLSESGVIHRINTKAIRAVKLRGRYVIPRAELARLIWENLPPLTH